MTYDMISIMAVGVYVGAYALIVLSIKMTGAAIVLSSIMIIRKICTNREYRQQFPIHVTKKEHQLFRRTK